VATNWPISLWRQISCGDKLAHFLVATNLLWRQISCGDKSLVATNWPISLWRQISCGDKFAHFLVATNLLWRQIGPFPCGDKSLVATNLLWRQIGPFPCGDKSLLATNKLIFLWLQIVNSQIFYGNKFQISFFYKISIFLATTYSQFEKFIELLIFLMILSP
jgi:hypothetical protein